MVQFGFWGHLIWIEERWRWLNGRDRHSCHRADLAAVRWPLAAVRSLEALRLRVL